MGCANNGGRFDDPAAHRKHSHSTNSDVLLPRKEALQYAPRKMKGSACFQMAVYWLAKLLL